MPRNSALYVDTISKSVRYNIGGRLQGSNLQLSLRCSTILRENRNCSILSKGIENPSTLKKLHHLFAPTEDLQEISMSSGWGEEFIEISRIIDSFKL